MLPFATLEALLHLHSKVFGKVYSSFNAESLTGILEGQSCLHTWSRNRRPIPESECGGVAQRGEGECQPDVAVEEEGGRGGGSGALTIFTPPFLTLTSQLSSTTTTASVHGMRY